MTQTTTDSTIEAILGAARRAGAQQAEVFHLRNEETPVRFEANRLKELNARETSGVAVRVIADGRIGFASSTRPGDTEDVVRAALETAPFGPEAHFDFPGLSEAPAVACHDPAVETIPVDDLIQTGQQLIDAVRRAEPDLLCDGSVRRARGSVTIANSNGGHFTYRATNYSAFVYGTLIRGTDMLFVGDGAATCGTDLDAAQIEETIVRQLQYAKRNAAVRSGELPVVFTSAGVADALLGPLAMAFSGRLVHQGQSPLAGRLGQELYDTRLSVHDDATLDMRPPSRPFDDEGMPSRRVPLVDKGIVRSFLYDLQTAGMAKQESTASAERSLTSQPGISASCLMVATGDTTFADMVRGIKEGVVVEELMGAGQGNVLGGDFSGNVLLGYKIEAGEIVGRVKDTIVAGNVHEDMKRIVAIGSEGRWVGGSTFCPPIWFGRLTVSSKS